MCQIVSLVPWGQGVAQLSAHVSLVIPSLNDADSRPYGPAPLPKHAPTLRRGCGNGNALAVALATCTATWCDAGH
jgi:hypothetical protein